jgi:hypothetical protein
MLCAHCNDELDPSDHNCCEACDVQDQLRARVAELEYHLQTLLHAYRAGSSISISREAEMRKAANLPK